MRSSGRAGICWRRSGGWVIAWWIRASRVDGLLRPTEVGAAIRQLRAELEGGPRAHLGRDVRELSELLLQRERRQLGAERDPVEQELLSAMPDAAALVSREGWVRASNAAFDTLGVGGRTQGLSPLEITRSAELSEAVKRALEGTSRKLELAIGRGVYRVHLSPMLRGEVLIVLRDVTEAKRAEAARRDFVANASHELKTPISAVRAAAETLLAGAIDDPAHARQFAEIIGRHAERLAHLADDLLDLSRIETRQWGFDLAPVDVAAAAAEVLELHAPAAQGKGLELRIEVPEGAVVRADPGAFEHILVNLVDNAIKYTAAGGVKLRAQREGASWVVSVVDTGPGIERHHLPRLFERFYRVDPGRSREQGGTGLGLAIVKHLAQGMGGEVGVESGPGGSRFWVRIPSA